MEYSNKLAPDEPTFWRVCDGEKCHCDFRVTITNCEESSALMTLNIICIVWCLLNIILACSILYHRLFLLHQNIFDRSGWIPRPKPIESMVLFAIPFTFFRLTDSLVLILDIWKSSIIRSFLYEFPWQLGTTTLTCFLFGVVHTLANPISMTAGYYEEKGDIENSTIWIDITYGTWVFYTFFLGSMILYAGLRLLRILKQQLFMYEHVFHKNKSTNEYQQPNYTITITALVLFNGPLVTTSIGIAFLFDFKILRGISQISLGSSTDSSMDDPHYSSITISQDMNHLESTEHIIEKTTHIIHLNNDKAQDEDDDNDSDDIKDVEKK
ncbi:hypothetical protein BJ944DRAFT_252334 [Cunninghamella echinulata]|nr:hypothetical protein BJ944DRAFT_252334 [Cunninghamella echinulata]